MNEYTIYKLGSDNIFCKFNANGSGDLLSQLGIIFDIKSATEKEGKVMFETKCDKYIAVLESLGGAKNAPNGNNRGNVRGRATTAK